MEANPPLKARRHRPPRVPDNPMAQIARQIAKDAIDEAGTADALTAGMESHLQRRLGGSALYAYTNDRAVPPGDVLLAMALATGISLDDRLGIGREPSEVERQLDDFRSEMDRMRDTIAGLQARLDAPSTDARPSEREADQHAQAAAADRAANRREWARGAPADGPATVASPPSRRSGRQRGM
jgi:hypothetical protein